MKRLSLLATSLMVASAMLIFPRLSRAGVVMSETSISAGPNGGVTQHRTVYVQGNKQKVEKPGVDAITDLDKGVVYIVDKNQKKYVELPLQKPTSRPNGNNPGVQALRLAKTGQTRVIAKQSCTEYKGTQQNDVEHVAISACVSSDAPGANEVIAFEHKMFSRVKGIEPPNPNQKKDASSGLMLEKLSVVSFRVPDLSQGNNFRTASFLTKTEVKDIEVKQLPAETFVPPRDFEKLKNNPAAPHGPQIQPGHPNHNEFQV